MSLGVSALAAAIPGCAEYELIIPCLGPAAAPTPVPGMTYIYASKIGCALDCDLRNGHNKHHGGLATDDGPRINQALASASAANPITLVMDGSACISGLFLPAAGHWHIAGLGCGTGFFIKTGANNDGIHNGGSSAAIPNDPGPPAPTRGSNVTLQNFTINGNQGNGRNGDSTTGSFRGIGLTTQPPNYWFFSINLMNLDNIQIKNLVIVNSPTYHIRLSNVGHAQVSGCVFRSFGSSTDGIHIDGPANDIAIDSCNFTTADDAIALNCPEGYSGNISRVQVSNCKFNAWTLMRLYTTDGVRSCKIDSVAVTGCTGSLWESAFLIGLYPGSLPASIASLSVSDCDLSAPALLAMAENFGTIRLKNVTFTPTTTSQLIWRPRNNESCGIFRPSPLYGDVHFRGDYLSFENCRIVRDSHVDLTPILLANNSSVAKMEFNGFSLDQGSSYKPIPNAIEIYSGAITQLVLNAITPTSMLAAASAAAFANISTVTGTGVLASGWEFPDAVMADNVPYISASSGQPSIKVNGVVQPYPHA